MNNYFNLQPEVGNISNPSPTHSSSTQTVSASVSSSSTHQSNTAVTAGAISSSSAIHAAAAALMIPSYARNTATGATDSPSTQAPALAGANGTVISLPGPRAILAGSAASALPPPRQPYTLPSAPSVHSRERTPPHSSAAAGVVDDHKRSRACDNCRALKVRCAPHDENDPAGVCHRCFKTNRPCVFTVNPRKRQRRTDTRVADLEKRVNELTQRLIVATGDDHEGDEATSPEGDMLPQMKEMGTPMAEDRTMSTPLSTLSSNPSPLPMPLHPPSASVHTQQPAQTTATQQPPVINTPRPPQIGRGIFTRGLSFNGDIRGTAGVMRRAFFTENIMAEIWGLRVTKPRHIVDILLRHNITDEVAQAAFAYYLQNLLPQIPCILFPPGTTFLDVLMQRPVLSLAILAVGMRYQTKGTEISVNLTVEAFKVISEQILAVGYKSLDLVQGLITLCLWYNHPEMYGCHKVHVFTACAIAIARDLGLGRLPQPQRKRKPGDSCVPQSSDALNPNSIECRRLWMALYTAGSTLSVLFRNSRLLPWSSYLDSCCELLEKNNDSPADAQFCKLVRLHSILDEILLIFHQPESTEPVDINDYRISVMLKVFERRLQDWKASSPENSPFLEICYHSGQIYLHEVGLHTRTNRNDFVAPFTEESLTPDTAVITGHHAEVIAWLISSSQTIIDVFCSVPAQEWIVVPVYLMGRVLYACTILLKIALVAIKTTRFATVCSMNMLRPEYYLGRTYQLLSEMCEDERVSLTTTKFKYVLGQLYLWFHTQKENFLAQKARAATTAAAAASASTTTAENKTDAEIKYATTFGEAAHASTLDMLSAVAVQEQELSSVSPTPSAQAGLTAMTRTSASSAAVDSQSGPQSATSDDDDDEELRMPKTGLALSEHLLQEYNELKDEMIFNGQGQQQNRAATTAGAATGGNGSGPAGTAPPLTMLHYMHLNAQFSTPIEAGVAARSFAAQEAAQVEQEAATTQASATASSTSVATPTSSGMMAMGPAAGGIPTAYSQESAPTPGLDPSQQQYVPGEPYFPVFNWFGYNFPGAPVSGGGIGVSTGAVGFGQFEGTPTSAQTGGGTGQGGEVIDFSKLLVDDYFWNDMFTRNVGLAPELFSESGMVGAMNVF
ncbi:uncharacterized protein V1518DRAFT_422847 [Limtongia smithiae]|uniref:uncharacterized protein n=1 Tax=Limtongia smithiae TaxID=1125753 RepID=UPI0034CE88CB